MKKTALKWFEFTQNNSGGNFTVNGELCHRLFVQAATDDQAVEIAEGLGVYFDGCENGMDCPCCGDRWYRPSEINFPINYDKNRKFTNVREYAQFLANEYGWTTPDARLYYKNGKVVDINKQAPKAKKSRPFEP
jgi:hypothetical protein